MNWYETYFQDIPLNEKTLEKYKNMIPDSDKDENSYEAEYSKVIEKLNYYDKLNDINLELSKFNSLKLIEEELKLIKLLSKYTLQNNYLNYTFFIKSLKILENISNILSNRLKLNEIEHKHKNYNNYIPRCSYKFCSFKNECFYNYNMKTKNVCYQDHYVHNMVLADIIILKEYIEFKFNENKLIIPNKEILKSINTLSFVIEHMYSELKSRCLYLNDDEIEKEHFIKKNNK